MIMKRLVFSNQVTIHISKFNNTLFREKILSSVFFSRKIPQTYLSSQHSLVSFSLFNTNSMEKSSEPKTKTEYFTRQKYSTKIGELKEKYLHMPIDEKRKLYKCGTRYNTLDDVQTWEEYYHENKKDLIKMTAKKSSLGKTLGIKRDIRADLNKKVSLWRGDITTLEIDAIVNAANESLLGGGGVDGAIHRAAGKKLVEECSTLKGCKTGDAKITGGYKLPSKYVIHTVGPIGEQKSLLQSAYTSCLKLVKENDLVSVAFPCISTGIYGYSSVKAAPVAIECVRDWLEDEDTSKNVKRVIFCLFLQKDVDIYGELMQFYFPIDKKDIDDDEPDNKTKDDSINDVKTDPDEVVRSKKVRTDKETSLTQENLKNEPASLDMSTTKSESESRSLKDEDIKMETDAQEIKDENMEVDSDSKTIDEKDNDTDNIENGTKEKKLRKEEKEMKICETEQKMSPDKNLDKTKNKVDIPSDTKKEEKSSDTKKKEKSSDTKKEEKSSDTKKEEKGLDTKKEEKGSKPLTRSELKEKQMTKL